MQQKQCPRCNSILDIDAKYCLKCGYSFVESAVAPPPPPPPPPPWATLGGANAKKALYIGIVLIILAVVGLFLPIGIIGAAVYFSICACIAALAMSFAKKAMTAKEPNAKAATIVAIIAFATPLIIMAILNYAISQMF